MNDCRNAGLRDALPDLLNGRLSQLDTATLSAHVEGCTECKAELDLMRKVRASTTIIPQIDLTKISSMIGPYTGSSIRIVETPARRQRSFGLVWKLAAAAVVVLAGAWGLTHESATKGNRQTAALPPAVIASAPATVIAPAAPVNSASNESAPTSAEQQVASLSLVGNTQDLSDADLEQLLVDLDGIETLPSAEPPSVTPSLDEGGTDQ